MVAEELLNQYADCLERYFQVIAEISKSAELNSEMENINQETMETLTIVGNRLHSYLTPLLKEK